MNTTFPPPPNFQLFVNANFVFNTNGSSLQYYFLNTQTFPTPTPIEYHNDGTNPVISTVHVNRNENWSFDIIGNKDDTGSTLFYDLDGKKEIHFNMWLY